MRARAAFAIVTASVLGTICASAPAAWTEPVPIVGINSPYLDKALFLSYDGQTLYFTRQDGFDWHFTRMYQAIRDEVSGDLVVSEISTMTSSNHHVDYPWVSVDNLRMYYYIAYGTTRKLMMTERKSVDDPWRPGAGVTELNALGDVANPSLTPDELTIIFTATDVPGGAGGYDLWMATRPDRDSPFGNATNLTEINSAQFDFHPCICRDGLTLYFASMRNGKSQIFRATRVSVDAPFDELECLSSIDSTGEHVQYPFLGNDGTALYFVRWQGTETTDIYVSYICDDSGNQTFYADSIEGSDFDTGLSSGTAFATIQRGIEAAKDGDTVLVRPGVYTGEINFGGKAVTLRSQGDAATLENPDGIAVLFDHGEGSGSVLKNFVVANSFAGISITGGSPTISNVTVVRNMHGIVAYAGAEPDISNCIFWGNVVSDLLGCEARYSRTSEADSGPGNIDIEPLFVDPNKGDYHLLSERGRYWLEHNVWVLDVVTSPCIDAGNPEAAPSDEPAPNGGRVNMGAYGQTGYASRSNAVCVQFEVDFNGDGAVDVDDLTALMEHWLDVSGWTESHKAGSGSSGE